jgi:hypothetical protein
MRPVAISSPFNFKDGQDLSHRILVSNRNVDIIRAGALPADPLDIIEERYGGRQWSQRRDCAREWFSFMEL